MNHILKTSNRKHPLMAIFFIATMMACYNKNEPSMDDSGTIELSAEEISGETYTYKIFKLQGVENQAGFGYSISLNNHELLRRTHESNDGEIGIFTSRESAITAAENTIANLKNRPKKKSIQ